MGLIREIRVQFAIDFHGLHGIGHWARVRHHGLTLARLRSADLLVIELFAFLHDSRRQDEYIDTGHGERAARFAKSLNGIYFDLKPLQEDILCEAVRGHSNGDLHDDPTIQCCWDADRLDLGRVGIKPSKPYLSQLAHPLIERAYEMSVGRRPGHISGI